MSDTPSSLARLQDVVATLIGPDGCPWDKEQTPQTLCDYLAEETFELTDAVRRNHASDIREEMGDVLFLLLFIAKLSEREFSLAEVLDEAAAKMIRRHPHVFSDSACADREALLRTWETIKKAEKAEKAEQRSGVFASLPDALPPLLKAYRINAKAARANFTWDTDEDVETQVEAEWLEWLDAAATGDPDAMEHEFGDLLFTLVEMGRRKGLKANAALHKTTLRFLARFRYMEEKAAESGRDFAALDMEEKNRLWDEAKDLEKGNTA
ncbi:MazG family protein [uncultured delta proteobacterium]|uniref:MazG family protein n=1 Tax=uncultured delta proteobacterium TaxID=34034 RepID=A0A212J9Q7_9DELT|nr:MazG family protein [uncultured delta proteobacterium]